MANVMALGRAYLATARAVLKSDPDSQNKATDYFNKAKKAFRGGITKWPDEIAFYAYYAETAARSGDLGESEALLKSLAARESWKNRPEPQTLLAEFYGVSRRPVEAEAALRAVLQQNPANVDARSSSPICWST
jgi:thioredoxin-like negative regulator of GroEL